MMSMGRREFLQGLTAAGTATLLGAPGTPVAAEPPPEISTLRLSAAPALCYAPQFVADALLRAEGFSEVRYVKGDQYKALATGTVDVNTGMVGQLILRVDAGDPVTILTGTHVGCFELFATENIRAVRDLKGKTVAVPGFGTSHHVYVAAVAAYVGLDPRTDIRFVTPPTAEAIELLAQGKIDALMGFPPTSQELRAKKIGHVIVNGSLDRPWSQYFCCMLGANRDFVRKYPVATKRAVRALLKGNDLCSREPDQAVQRLRDQGFTVHPEYAVQALKELNYARWRDYDAEDTVRFHALRLYEAGMVKSSANRIMAQGTDWRFLTELKRELKG